MILSRTFENQGSTDIALQVLEFISSLSLLDVNIRVIFAIFIFSGMVRGGSRTAATSKMERFVMIINGF